MIIIEIDGKDYQLNIDEAKEKGVLKEKDNKPYSWEEYDKALKQLYITSAYDEIGIGGTSYDRFITENEAKAFCALGKIIQLRDRWCDNWKPDWNKDYTKYTIVNTKDHIELNTATFNSKILAFPTKEMATDFLETFRDLIEEAKIFL